MADWDAARKRDALERMLTIRRFEETVVGLFEAHEFMTHFHLYIGQEATGVPLMQALGPDDKIATHHRNHGHILARGTDPKIALAEILGRENGMNRGAGGTMHLSDVDRGFLSTSAIVGGSISLAIGAGFALKNQGGDAVSVGLFGDGALEEGVSYESLNLAALWSLPVVFVCENNSEGALGSAGGGFPTSVSAVDDLTKIPETFGIPVETVDGRDVEGVYDVATRAVAHARARKGPYFVHVATARFAGTQPLWPNLPTGPTRDLDGLGRLGHGRRARGLVPRARPGAPLRPRAAGVRRHRPGRADEARRAGDRADRRGAPVRAGQPAAHARERTRPRLCLRRRQAWPPRTTPTRCWTSSRRSWRRTRSSR